MRAIPDFDFAQMRLVGVLQRIGIVYLATATLYSTATGIGVRADGRIPGGILGSDNPGARTGLRRGDLSPDGNLAAYVDRMLMPGRLWQGTWDPEGLLSTIPAIATALLGVFLESGSGLVAPEPSSPDRWCSAGVTLTLVGLGWDLLFPINKNLWTSSYVVFTAGTAARRLGTLSGRSTCALAGGVGEVDGRLRDERPRRVRPLPGWLRKRCARPRGWRGRHLSVQLALREPFPLVGRVTTTVPSPSPCRTWGSGSGLRGSCTPSGSTSSSDGTIGLPSAGDRGDFAVARSTRIAEPTQDPRRS